MTTEKNKPREYDFSKKAEIKRWFAEMEGYLKTGYGEHRTFVNMGTDFDGRKFALEGFFKLKEMMLKQPIFTPEEIKDMRACNLCCEIGSKNRKVMKIRSSWLKKLKQVTEK